VSLISGWGASIGSSVGVTDIGLIISGAWPEAWSMPERVTRVIAARIKPIAKNERFCGKDSFMMDKEHAPEKHHYEQIVKGIFFFRVYPTWHVCDN
jgi:hypothetical protein